MALTKIGTEGIKDDAVTTDKVANAINTSIATNTAKDLTALSASNLTSGTIPDARFPATLPAASAANLTAVPAANITGTLPAISATNLTNVPAANITGTLPAIDGSNLTGVSGGKILQVSTKKTTTSNHTSNAGTGDYPVLESDAITVSAGSTCVIFGNYHVWMQDNSNPFHGTRKIQREIGGSGSWSNVRGVGYSTFEYQMQSVNMNADSNLQAVNAIDTHGQSAGTSIKYRIVHGSSAPSSCDSLTFQRGGNESNIMILEVGS